MDTIFPTITIAFFIFLVAFVFLGIGLIFTGKAKIQRGSCSRVPGKKKEGCSNSCDICSNNKTPEEDGKKK